ncbi:MAG TPA: hypothetical protein VH373_24925 [Jatrophihabitantaceae bacterium]|jgi:hypothetical protein
MTARPRLVGLGAIAGAATALMLIAAPQASAATARTAEAYTGWDTSLSGLTHQQFATSCGDVFKGPVTSDDGHGNIVAGVNSFSMSCDQGVSVTPNALPWTLTAHGNNTPGSSYTIAGIDVNITTAQGTCRYTGSVNGTAMDQGYFMAGTLSRQSAGCGGDAQVQVNDPFEVFGIA